MKEILRYVLENNENARAVGEAIGFDAFGSEGSFFLASVSKFYEETEEETAIGKFPAWVNTQPNKRELLLSLYEQAMEVDTSTKLYQTILDTYQKRLVATEIAIQAEHFLTTHDDRAFSAVRQALDRLDESNELETTPVDLDYVLEQTVQEAGLRWRLPCLNRSLGPLRKGDFIILAARPETGKTTMLASEATYMIEQGARVLWVNNEERGEKVMLRITEALFGATKDQILANRKKAATKLAAYKDRIVLVEPQFYWEVEALVKRVEPSLIVFDMLDKVQGFKGDREDLRHAEAYRWARRLARFAPVITSSQATGDAENRKWIPLSMLAGSRTAKQAEADAIIMLGKDNDEEHIRYLNIVKNKLAGDENSVEEMRHGKFEILLDRQRARYSCI